MTILHVFSLTWIYLNLPCNLDFSKSLPYFWVGAPSYPWPWTPYATDRCQELLRKPPTSLFPWGCPSRTFALRSFKSMFVSTWAKRNNIHSTPFCWSWNWLLCSSIPSWSDDAFPSCSVNSRRPCNWGLPDCIRSVLSFCVHLSLAQSCQWLWRRCAQIARGRWVKTQGTHLLHCIAQ